jgi:hypothetical protein
MAKKRDLGIPFVRLALKQQFNKVISLFNEHVEKIVANG